MNIFRQLRWKLTLNFTLVTVGTLLVITLVLGGILLIRIFQATVYLSPGYSPTNYIDGFMDVENETGSYLYYCQTLSQTPQDLSLVDRMLSKMQSVFAQYHLFRIAQESLNNVYKYARVTQVQVSLFLFPAGLRFEVCDNGIGFDMSTSKSISLGMRIVMNVRKPSVLSCTSAAPRAQALVWK